MKKYIFLIILFSISNLSFSQLTITAGAQWVSDGSPQIVLNNIDFINNGTMLPGGSNVKFIGNNNNVIGGNTATNFFELEVGKMGGNKVLLNNNIEILKRVLFTSGLIDLNQFNITLSETAYLDNESEASRITGLSGGEVIITIPMNAPAGNNAGNMGAVITSLSDLGSVSIKRGHKNQSGTGMINSIHRYFDISPSNNVALNATFRYNYFDAEMNGQTENSLAMFRSIDAGLNWSSQNFGIRDAVANYVENTGINSFSRWALSSATGVLPVTGLEFNAKRINSNLVQLNWKTLQEFNNLGFSIERKKENENNFSSTGFVNSLAIGGNSILPLNYSTTDINNYSGKTYYQLKQKDIDGRTSYSVVRVVAGSETTASLKVWPVPSVGEVNILLFGVEKDLIQVFDMSGRLIQQVPVFNNTQQKIRGLMPGHYIIKLAGQQDLNQKIIIQ